MTKADDKKQTEILDKIYEALEEVRDAQGADGDDARIHASNAQGLLEDALQLIKPDFLNEFGNRKG